MGTQQSAVAAQKGQPPIHPLFAPSQFPQDIDWEKALRKSAILATRLLDSPQAEHFVYSFLFGVNTDTELPEEAKAHGHPKAVPHEFACNKGIGQLSMDDINAVRQHLVKLSGYVFFRIGCADGDENWSGEAERVKKSSPKIPYDSCVISISREWYNRALSRNDREPDEAASIEFALATVMLHEMAHALHIIFMGLHTRTEDFFENSLVAELGNEFEARLFGLCPMVSTCCPRKSSFWREWQTLKVAERGLDLRKVGRNVSEILEFGYLAYFKTEFAVMLADDEFWDEWDQKPARERARMLLPECVVNICQTGDGRGMPQSIQDLFWTKEGKTYAEKNYSGFTNPKQIPRYAAFLDCKSGDDQDVTQEDYHGACQECNCGDSQGDDEEYDDENDEDYSPEDGQGDDQEDSDSDSSWSEDEDDEEDSDSEDSGSEDDQEDSDPEGPWS